MKEPELTDVHITRTSDGTIWAVCSIGREIAPFYIASEKYGVREWRGGVAQQAKMNSAYSLVGELKDEFRSKLDFHVDAYLDRERVSGT